MTEVADHEARHMAERAMDAIRSHEDLCGERWGQSRKGVDTLTETVDEGFRESNKSRERLHGRIDGVVDLIGKLQLKFWIGIATLLMGGLGAMFSLAVYLTKQIAEIKGVTLP